MKKIILIFSVIIIAVGLFVLVPNNNRIHEGNPVGCVSINFDDIDYYDLDWGNLSRVLKPFLEIGMTQFEIGDFKWDLPFMGGDWELLNPDPLLVKASDRKYDIKPLKIWSKKHPEGVIDISFGEWVDFEVIVTVMNIMRSNSRYLHLSTYEEDKESILIDINNVHKPLQITEPNQSSEPTSLDACD